MQAPTPNNPAEGGLVSPLQKTRTAAAGRSSPSWLVAGALSFRRRQTPEGPCRQSGLGNGSGRYSSGRRFQILRGGQPLAALEDLDGRRGLLSGQGEVIGRGLEACHGDLQGRLVRVCHNALT